MSRQSLTLFFVFIAFILSIGSVDAQELFTGIVVDSASLGALPQVNVQVRHGSAGTTTDEKGNFSIRAMRSDILVFSLVGYETLEVPLTDYESGIIRLNEKYTLLQAVTIDEYRRENLYEGMFEEQNAQRQRHIPFYFSKAKKEKIKVAVLRQENILVKTYVDVVVNNPELKAGLMKKHSLSEADYYRLLTAFNETHHRVMYHLTQAELISLLNTFFETQAAK